MSGKWENIKQMDMEKERVLPACRLLHPLVAIQDAFEQLSHEGFEMAVRGLADHPVGVAAKGPASNGADQSFLVTQTLNEVGDELGQVRYHPLHAAWVDKKVVYNIKAKSAMKYQDRSFQI